MYHLHPQLESDSLALTRLDLSEVRLLNDRRFPWVLLIPMRDSITELHQLSTGEQQQLLHESSRVAGILCDLPGVEKLNLGALGNLVPQFHWHLVGRHKGDHCWPGPVWGCGERQAYSQTEAETLVALLQRGLNR